MPLEENCFRPISVVLPLVRDELWLRRLVYDGITLHLDLLTGNNENLVMQIKTSSVRSAFVQTDTQALALCRMHIEKVHSKIPTDENGYYTAPSDFTAVMNAMRRGQSMFWGLKGESYCYFSLMGYGELVGCVVKSFDDICWKWA